MIFLFLLIKFPVLCIRMPVYIKYINKGIQNHERGIEEKVYIDIKHYAFSRFSLGLNSCWVSGFRGECVLGQIRNTLKASLQP